MSRVRASTRGRRAGAPGSRTRVRIRKPCSGSGADAMVAAQGAAGQEEHLQRPDHPHPVARGDMRAADFRVHPPQQPVQARVAVALGHGPRSGGAGPGRARDPRRGLGGGRAGRGRCPPRRGAGAPAPPRRAPRPAACRAYSAAEKSWPGSATSKRWCGTRRRSSGGRLGAAHVEPAVDLQAVAGHDLAPVRAGQLEGEGRLARGGGADDRDQGSCQYRYAVYRRRRPSRIAAPRTCCRVTACPDHSRARVSQRANDSSWSQGQRHATASSGTTARWQGKAGGSSGSIRARFWLPTRSDYS